MLAPVEEEADGMLLRAWKAGDERAGARLYRRHAAAVRRFLRNKVAERDVADLMQATFMVCFEQSDRYREGASFRAFMLAFARNLLMHHYRTRYRKDDRVDFGVSSVVELGVSPSALIAGQQEERRLLAALRSLPIEQQILLELFYWESMQGPELAELYELPEGTIRTRLRTARLRLVEAFAQLEGAGADANESTSLEAWARGIRERLGDAQGDAKVKE
jgi:RNA polymerase sigma factor (sigma-70 family)